MKSYIRTGVLLALLGTVGAAMAQSCEQAWADYNEFKKRAEMDPAQYPLTSYGAAVRAACGPEALPAPPGTDTPPPPRVRKSKPVPPPEKPKVPPTN